MNQQTGIDTQVNYICKPYLLLFDISYWSINYNIKCIYKLDEQYICKIKVFTFKRYELFLVAY